MQLPGEDDWEAAVAAVKGEREAGSVLHYGFQVSAAEDCAAGVVAGGVAVAACDCEKIGAVVVAPAVEPVVAFPWRPAPFGVEYASRVPPGSG